MNTQMNNRRIVGGAAAAALSILSLPAYAQFADPLGAKPKPNLIVGFDTSVTMGISSNCSGCHRDNPWITSRLQEAKVDIRATLPLFKDLFIMGGFQYQGCGSAHIARWEIPNMADLPGSYTRVDNMIASAWECGSSERYLPAGTAGTCITPTVGCIGDVPILQGLADRSLNVNGLTLPLVPATTTTVCGTPARLGISFDAAAFLISKLATISWPRWGAGFTAADVNTQLCQPLEAALIATRDQIASCSLHPSLFWDLASFVGAGVGTWCTPGLVMNDICQPWSPFNGSCVCDDTNILCQLGARPLTECGLPLDWKARQQTGVCASYADTWGGSPTLGTYFNSQPDNVRHGKCRENVSVFFTDGAYGSTAGTAAEVSQALTATYNSATGQSNMFVFHVSNYFGGEAAAMAAAMTNPLYDATNPNAMLDSFSRIVNRVYTGDYSAANMTVDRFGTRAVFHLFKVPSGPGLTGERYLGRPSKLMLMALDSAGNVVPTPIVETDWASRVSYAPLNGGGNGLLCASVAPSPGVPTLGPGTGCSMSALETDTFGPGGTFRNGVARNQSLTIDGYARKWGYMLGGSNTQPVIVDAPREVPQGSTLDLNWQNFLNNATVKNRPRVIYVMSDGFLHAIHGGDRVDGAPTISIAGVAQKLRYNYNDNPATTQTGKELFRYFIRSYNTVTDWQLNDVVPRPVSTGQIVVKEMAISNAGTPLQRFATVLALAQGKDGRGFATLNVTDPTQPRLLAEWVLPAGSTASNEPMMYQFPPVGTLPTPVVVVTGGLNGSRTLYAYDVRNGALVSSISLPGGASYPTEPVCLDASGAGVITHCYVLSRDGELVRVLVGAGGTFTSATTIFTNSMGAGRVFLTRPVGFFGPDGAVNLAYGSGLSTDLTAADSAQNGLFKVVDPTNRLPSGTVTNVNVCTIGGAATDGFINIGSERIVAPPVISKGVIAFTTYLAVSDGCTSGSAKLYAMDYAKCTDAFDPSRTAPPTPTALPPGIPASPVILRGKSVVLTQASNGANPTPDSQSAGGALTRGGALTPFRALYWRPSVNAH